MKSSDTAAPFVTVVIVAYNSGALLQECVDALARQTLREFEAIIVDNASEDGSIARLRLPDDRFRVVDAGSNLGFAAANNLAVRKATTPWVATLNPDALAAPNWLAALKRATEHYPGAAMFGSTQLDAADDKRLDGCGDAYSFLGISWRGLHGRSIDLLPPVGETFAPCAAAALYRRDAFDHVGGFDERFFCYCEDVDLGFRIRLIGGVCIQLPDAVVRHVGSAITGRDSYFTLFHSARNRVWLMMKNLPLALLVLLLPIHLAYMALTMVRHRRDDTHYFSATWAGLRTAFADLSPALRARREIQARRRVSSFAVARMLCWDPRKLWRCDPDIRPLRMP
jgi:GT2 family glycosyltransferase